MVAVLALCQAMLLTNNIIIVTLSGILGHALASDKALATLPLTAYVLGTALSTVPASLWMRRVGRRAGFMTGAALGASGALAAALAIAAGSFWGLCGGTVLIGSYNAFGQQYRFAAAEIVNEAWRGRAISWVLAGGIVGAMVGPETAKWTRGLMAVPFLSSYLFLAALAVAALLVQTSLRLPMPRQKRSGEAVRPLSRIVRQPVFLAAALGGAVGYGVMNFLMTATPLAMMAHHHAFADTAFVIEWHAFAMFAPSFVTGALIARWGVLTVTGTGALLMIGCIAAAGFSTSVPGFWTALVLLGVGWNFLFVGGTTLLTEAHRPAERAKVQGLNDFLVFGTTASASLFSGVLLEQLGWPRMAYWMVPFLALVLSVLVWLAFRRRAQKVSLGL
jgi:MFS family permease